MKKRTVKDFIALYAPEDEEKLVLIQDGVSADKTFLDTYDWHIGAMPERYTYDKTGQKQPLNELALDLIPGDYGRAVCNGRFRDWDTGIWYYALDILNVMPLTELTDSLTSFTDREPSKIYTKIDRLW